MWHSLLRIFDYWGYFFQSTDLHGIHSPFIYQFSEFCFYHKREKRIQYIEIQRSKMLMSSGKLRDYSISKFTDRFTLDAKYCFALHRISHFLNVSTINEYGLTVGIETNYLLEYALNQKKQSVNYAYHYSENQVKQFTNETWYKEIVQAPLVSISNPSPWELHIIHQHDNPDEIWDYADKILKLAHNHTVVILSNIHLTDDHTLNWRRLQNDERTGVSLDLFNMGIIFFRKEQPKEHFTLRY